MANKKNCETTLKMFSYSVEMTISCKKIEKLIVFFFRNFVLHDCRIDRKRIVIPIKRLLTDWNLPYQEVRRMNNHRTYLPIIPTFNFKFLKLKVRYIFMKNVLEVKLLKVGYFVKRICLKSTQVKRNQNKLS